jgi:7-cyano-7-deazaguanine synthase in queuosine biosynthesis
MSEDAALPLRRIEAVEPGFAARGGYEPCKIGSAVALDPRQLVSYCSGKWEPVVYDALLVCAVVEYCDRMCKRPSRSWGRHFDAMVPVSDPARWEDPAVKGALIGALRKLTGDRWEISFVPRRTPYPEIIQATLQWPQPSSIMMPFSEGMDSRAVATLMHTEPLVLVRLGMKQIDRPKVGGRRLAFTTVPYKVPGRDFPETSGRSRGFKFAMVGALAAYLSGAKRIAVPESGQGALGPVLAGHHDGDYRSHPVFLRQMERFVRALFGSEIAYEFPRLWSTKGQTLRAAIAAAADIPWRKTRSCWQPSTQMSVPGERRQCGFCASCMLRRLSVHSAGETDDAGSYILEDLSAPTLTAGIASGYDLSKLGEAQQGYAVAGALHMDHLAALSAVADKPFSFGRQMRELAKALDACAADVERRAREMLGQHEAEWRAFLRSLAPSSFVRQRSMVVS